ncbi:MAG: crossover junction endodeoxyribonuclease RuvC [Alphaproteobacteria bacterium]|nr:crossover junction endodeoxyribonuclease RuvC [Alphaproteobacteria bacterium]
MTRILGIDPGLQHTGWGVIDAKGNQLSFVACGAVHSDPKLPTPARLQQLHDGLHKIIALHKPSEAAVEETFINKNASSSLKLGHARGAILLSLSLAGVPVAEYSANLVKKSVVGKGHADKAQVAMMVKVLLPHSVAESADAADALAVAITHAHHRR